MSCENVQFPETYLLEWVRKPPEGRHCRVLVVRYLRDCLLRHTPDGILADQLQLKLLFYHYQR